MHVGVSCVCGVGLSSFGRMPLGSVCAWVAITQPVATAAGLGVGVGGHKDPVCMCVSYKTLPQSINIYIDACHKSARPANT